MIDPRTPVVVGVGQITRRPGDDADLAAAPEPADLMAEAIRQADVDAGGRRSFVDRIDVIWVPQPLTRRYPDPGAVTLRRLGVEARSYRALIGGNSPQLLVGEAAAMIQRGGAEVCVIAGAEAMYTRFRARKLGVDLPWERSDVPACPNEVGDIRPGTSDVENAHGATLPIEIYPLIETAVRAARGRSLEEHQRATGLLWSRFAAVAAANPLAWTPVPYTPDEVTTPAPDNRVVTFPYTKRMCANLAVDQAAAVMVTTHEAAVAAGVPADRMVFPLAGADANDHFFLTERWSLADSPAIRAVAADLFAATSTGVDAVARFDLYSCFPSAVQVAMDALGIHAADERPLTLTGGLALFGGPGNNYVTHSIAETVHACRRDPGSLSMVTGVGWYLTKHSAGLYSTTPPPEGFRRVAPGDTQAKVDALPKRIVVAEHDGPARVEATAVPFTRDGSPERGLVSTLTEDGHRALAVTDDPDALASMVAEPWEGRAVSLRPAEGRTRLVS